MSYKTSVTYRCKHEECEHEFEVEVEYTDLVPAQISGPPENCYPAEGGDVDIIGDETCPKCGHTIDLEKVQDTLWDKLTDQRYDSYDHHRDE